VNPIIREEMLLQEGSEVILKDNEKNDVHLIICYNRLLQYLKQKAK